MEEKKVNVGCFIEFCLFVVMMCSVTQCLGVISLGTRLKDIDKDIHTLIVRDSVAIESTVGDTVCTEDGYELVSSNV